MSSADTLALKKELLSHMQPAQRQQVYWNCFKQFVRGKLSKRELEQAARAALGGRLPLHNEFVRAVNANAELAARTLPNDPSTVKLARKRKRPTAAEAAGGYAGVAPPKRAGSEGFNLRVQTPLLGCAPAPVYAGHARSLLRILVDEYSYGALHNRVLQHALAMPAARPHPPTAPPTAVAAVAPDAVLLVMAAMGVRIQAEVECASRVASAEAARMAAAR